MTPILPLGARRDSAFEPQAIDLPSLVAARLCHDLVSPLGAIGNGLELLQMVLPPSPELELIADAVSDAQARVRLLRLAFGVAPPDQTIPAADLVAALSALQSAGRISLRTTLPGPLPRAQARRLALAALCAQTALAWGGEIGLDAHSVTAIAPRLKLDADLWQRLERGQPPAPATAANVHFALLAASGPVAVTRRDAGLTLRL